MEVLSSSIDIISDAMATYNVLHTVLDAIIAYGVWKLLDRLFNKRH